MIDEEKIPLSLLMVFFLLVTSAAEKKERVMLKLSDEEPGSEDYDHEAFLGEETAQKFDQLSPEESKRRLGIIYDKMDTDHDGIVHEKELEKWIELTQERHIEEDSNERFVKYDTDKDGLIQWDEYYKQTYGGLKEADWKIGESEGFSYVDMHKRDRKRWEVADIDDDDACSKTEYRAFVHPQHFKHMKDIVFQETMADIDRNGDGYLDMEEYINDVYRPEVKGEPEPDWVATEREQFVLDRDTNKDGRLDEQEVREWIMPDDYNYPLAEAKHLLYESDTDRDGVLTKEEVTDHYDTFVGSQATQWGEIFGRHDEF